MGLIPVDASSGHTGDVLSAADAACYAAKEAGEHRVREYQGDDASLAERRGEMRWVQRIQKALDGGELRLLFQPIVPLHDGAGAFLGTAERYRIVTALDRWVLTAALDALTAAADNGGDLPVFTVNLSGQSLSDDSFLSFLTSHLESNPLARSKVCFETETAAIANLARARTLLSTVRGYGCRLALDDFGSGLGSFSYLQNVPVDYLKMDGCFVVGMAANPMQHAIVEAINQIGHVMGIQTIAEWVENDATLNAVRAMGGRLFPRPRHGRADALE
jgi:EAL domain-containing protein (putative c-di-GMP-specific phosphodiesterase class I)